jgi:hypothetical protein
VKAKEKVYLLFKKTYTQDSLGQGQIEKFFFSSSALTPSVKLLGLISFNFCTNSNA